MMRVPSGLPDGLLLIVDHPASAFLLNGGTFPNESWLTMDLTPPSSQTPLRDVSVTLGGFHRFSRPVLCNEIVTQ